MCGAIGSELVSKLVGKLVRAPRREGSSRACHRGRSASRLVRVRVRVRGRVRVRVRGRGRITVG